MNPSELFERSAVGELSAPSAPIRGHIGGALDARPGQCSDPGVAVHSGRGLSLGGAARLHRSVDAPGLSIASLPALYRGVPLTKKASARAKRRHHGKSVEVTGSNPAKPLWKQLELGSHGGHRAS